MSMAKAMSHDNIILEHSGLSKESRPAQLRGIVGPNRVLDRARLLSQHEPDILLRRPTETSALFQYDLRSLDSSLAGSVFLDANEHPAYFAFTGGDGRK